MPAETARAFEALEAQARQLMAVFVAAGCEAVSPAIIQPAGVFLDTIGEQLRARTYVFTDQDGDELCLRPDITVPTCRLHLERHPQGRTRARYCYNGVAFRFQPVGAGAAHPREFHQAGIESFGESHPTRADVWVVATVLDGLRAAGLTGWRLRVGDLGLFHAILAVADMPERWRERLRLRFWRPQVFRAELLRLMAGTPGRRSGYAGGILSEIDSDKPEAAERIVAAHLEARGIEVIGTRSLADITGNLLAASQDARSAPLPAAIGRLIERYLALECPASEAGARVAALAKEHGLDVRAAADAFQHRLGLLAESGVETAESLFSAEFGRGLEYYTGFVFEIVAPTLGPASPVAGGGRYDTLLRIVGAPQDVPAVGAAIHTERLLAAIEGVRP